MILMIFAINLSTNNVSLSNMPQTQLLDTRLKCLLWASVLDAYWVKYLSQVFLITIIEINTHLKCRLPLLKKRIIFTPLPRNETSHQSTCAFSNTKTSHQLAFDMTHDSYIQLYQVSKPDHL